MSEAAQHPATTSGKNYDSSPITTRITRQKSAFEMRRFSEQYRYRDAIEKCIYVFYLLPLGCYSTFFPPFITSQAHTVAYCRSESGLAFPPSYNATFHHRLLHRLLVHSDSQRFRICI